MVGSVNYGSGKRAYNPQETVAGKTGTCIGDDGWVGLFTSYAPLASPRLAIVVIARGTDAHGHFPAAVAGQIYRELGNRFGTPTNLQIANQLNSDMRSEGKDRQAVLDEEDSEVSAAEEESADGTVAKPRTGGTSAVSRTNAAQTTPINSATNNKNVRRVLLPIPDRSRQPVLRVTGSMPSLKPSSTAGQRPRRVGTDQP